MSVRVLIVAEHLGGALNPSTARCVTCALEVAPEAIDVVVLSDAPEAVARAAAGIAGVSAVLTVARPENAHPLAAVLAPQIAAAATGYSHVLLPSTTFGKDVAPRVAALLGVDQVSDLSSVVDPYRFTRPIHAGNVVVTLVADAGSVVVATVRTASFAVAPAGGSAPIAPLELTVALPTHTRFVELRRGAGDRPDLQNADIVVSGGLGLGSGDKFSLIYDLADALGAAVGASRAAVDAGYVANDLQVGQTGKIIAPGLYIAIGISGAIQHLTGIKEAGTIVAINSDPQAPIFEIADFGLVGDLFTVVPALTAALKT